MKITNGRLDSAIQKPSPNHSGRISPKFIVMHYTAGWEAESAINTFADPDANVSAQFTIDTDGTIYQHVSCDDKAWHAGPSTYAGYSGLNSHSIGIEFVNPGYLKKTNGGYIDAYGHFVSEARAGDTIASAHSRVGSGTFYWPVYTENQLKAADELVEAIMAEYPIIDIVSHEEIDNRGWKTDPGPAFPMNRFRASLRDRGNDVVTYEVTASALNVRSGPGTNYRVSDKLHRGNKVVGLNTRGEWIQIDSDGWVHGDYLRRVR